MPFSSCARTAGAAEEELRQWKARRRSEARQKARQAAKDELRSIVKTWNDAFALEAFFNEVSRRATALDGEERVKLEERIRIARELTGGQEAIERFLRWSFPVKPYPDDPAAEPVDDED
jgi:hypothetical protein